MEIGGISLYSYIIVHNGIDSDKNSNEECRVITGQRTAKPDGSYYWNPAVFKKPKFVVTQPRKCVQQKGESFMEKKWNPTLWKPLGIHPVEEKDCIKPGKQESFLDYQAPTDRYEVRGIMPKAPAGETGG